MNTKTNRRGARADAGTRGRVGRGKPVRRKDPIPINPDNDFPRRKSTRIPGYDYATSGAYHVTICVKNRTCMLGEVVGTEVDHSKIGQIIDKECRKIPTRHAHVEIDTFIVMPNHVHMLVLLTEDGSEALGELVRAFKARCTRKIHTEIDERFAWQRGYHERIVRDERHMNAVRKYIEENPAKWDEDTENPDVGSSK